MEGVMLVPVQSRWKMSLNEALRLVGGTKGPLSARGSLNPKGKYSVAASLPSNENKDLKTPVIKIGYIGSKRD
jgi:hypothetical protein